MAATRIPLPTQNVDFAAKCREWLRTAAQQKAVAREMMKRSHKMRHRALEMMKPPSPRRSSDFDALA